MKRKKNPKSLRLALLDRRHAMEGGERLLARAEALELESTTDCKRGRQKLREAALFYESAARACQRATLGLLAKRHWGRALACYEQLTDSLLESRCKEQIDAIDDIWTDSDAEPA